MEMRMNLQVADYNGSEHQLVSYHHDRWAELEAVLVDLPLHLKASDQSGMQGTLIFDPVGTNEFIKTRLIAAGWASGIPIPSQFSFLGTDVDFGKDGTLVEAQFSNYPFLLNNALRSELFFKAKLPLAGRPTELLVVITKAHRLPASNSTLYFEQAQSQLDALVKNGVFEVPIRLVGLFEDYDTLISATVTEYASARYSRTVSNQRNVGCILRRGRTSRSRGLIDCS